MSSKITEGSAVCGEQKVSAKLTDEVLILFLLLIFLPIGDKINLLHNSNILQINGVYFYLPIKIHALFSHTIYLYRKNCVATVGAMCFLVRGFGCALFYFFKEEEKCQTN